MPPTLTVGSQSWTLNRGTTTIGRQDTCDIVISDRSLSRAHATLEVSRDAIELSDNNSSNGTFVNNLRIANQRLKHGDVVRFGNMEGLFSWPESVVEVSASPISAQQAQDIRQKLTARAEVKTDWKATLATVAAFSAITTGVVSGIVGAMMGADALLTAVMVGAVGGIATMLVVRNVTQQRVSGTLSTLKDDLDLFFSGQTDDIPIPSGFPELVDVVHSIRLGSELVKDRTANAWRMKVHEAQMALEAIRAVKETTTSDRGFTDPLIAMDNSFRVQGWSPAARILLRPDLDTIASVHLLQALHNQELGGQLIGVLNGLAPGQCQVIPQVPVASPDGRPMALVAVHTNQGIPSHEYLLLFVSPQA